MAEITQADIVERLRGLHVWPQSTADTYPDTLGPRRIKALYEVGEVAHEAADRIEALKAEIEQWRECALYDATMEGPVFKGWGMSALERCRRAALQEQSK